MTLTTTGIRHERHPACLIAVRHKPIQPHDGIAVHCIEELEMNEVLYKPNERLFILASELENLNKALIASNLGDAQRIQIMREYAQQREAQG